MLYAEVIDGGIIKLPLPSYNLYYYAVIYSQASLKLLIIFKGLRICRVIFYYYKLKIAVLRTLHTGAYAFIKVICMILIGYDDGYLGCLIRQSVYRMVITVGHTFFYSLIRYAQSVIMSRYSTDSCLKGIELGLWIRCSRSLVITPMIAYNRYMDDRLRHISALCKCLP